jgi:hypothetical protein
VGHRDRSGDNTGAYRSSFFIQGSPEETAHFAALRQRLGDEAIDRMLRSRELRRHPRPLTDEALTAETFRLSTYLAVQ